jgi:hypothetical protein
MTAYATPDDMERLVEGWVTDDSNALVRYLERASITIDGLLGSYPTIETGDYAGMKIDPTLLPDWQAEALRRAVCEQANYAIALGPKADTVGAPAKVSGPDFSVERAPAPSGGRVGPAVPGLVTRTRLRRPWTGMSPSPTGAPGRP